MIREKMERIRYDDDQRPMALGILLAVVLPVMSRRMKMGNNAMTRYVM